MQDKWRHQLGVWQAMYLETRGRPPAALRSVCEKLVGVYPELEGVVRHPPDTLERRYAALFETVARMPLALDAPGLWRLEEIWVKMARHYGFEEQYLRDLMTVRCNIMAKFGVTDGHVVAGAPRYLWCTIFAHVWAVSKNATTPTRMTEVFRVCHEGMGLSFDCFMETLAVIDAAAPVLPEPLRELARFYGELTAPKEAREE